MPRPHNALNSVRIASLRTPGRYADGNCLYLEVDPPVGNLPPLMRWVQRLVINGRRRDIGLGSYRTFSLKDARQKAAQYLALARSGGDPLAEKRKALRPVPSFKGAAKTVHESVKQGWKNRKHSDQWMSSLETYAFPKIGDRRLDQIDSSDVLGVLRPIWQKKPETARRVLLRIKTIMDWAKLHGHQAGDNPASNVKLALPAQPRQNGHHKAIPYGAVGDFIRKLHDSAAGEEVKLALELTILTAARTNEVIAANWSEIDLELGLWVIPANRMKASREYRIPLSDRAVEVLKKAKELAGGAAFVFPARKAGRHMSNMAMLMAMRRMKADGTVHGFRSSFRDWASEVSSFPRDLCEMALAHAVSNKTEAAYRRGDLLEKRRPLMKAWAHYVLSKPKAAVIPISQARKR